LLKSVFTRHKKTPVDKNLPGLYLELSWEVRYPSLPRTILDRL